MPASIQQIKKIRPAENSDNLELADVLGYQCVVQKGKFHANQRIVFIEIDSIVPNWQEYEFLKGNHLIKTIKLRGNISQGLIMALDDYKFMQSIDIEFLPIGHDVSNDLSIQKYEKPAPKCLDAAGYIPKCIPKTDEINIQSQPDLIAELSGHPYFITLKMDGCSATYYYNYFHESASDLKKFGVCSRNLELKEGNNIYWEMFRKYDLMDFCNAQAKFAIQGEIIGPGVQKNPHGLNELNLLVFDYFDIHNQRYCSREMLEDILVRRNMKFEGSVQLMPVPKIEEGFLFNYSLDKLLEMVTKMRDGRNRPIEGVVVRSAKNIRSKITGKRISFKVLNPNYGG